MNLNRILLPCAGIAFAASILAACDDNVSEIGSSLTQGDASITIDSIIYNLNASPVANNSYDSRTGNLMLGNINVPEYGKLKCSFVARMISAAQLSLPDTVTSERIDSCKMLFTSVHGNIIGDSLAPQQLSIFKLDKQLPSGITNTFDPEGYYDASGLLGKKNYTLSAASNQLFVLNSQTKILGYHIAVDLGRDYGVQLVEEYRKNPEIFTWPQTFAQYFPGIYVESSFGHGSIANISQAGLYVYYYTPYTKTTTVDDEKVTTIEHMADSICLMAVAPEALSSNNVRYTMAESLKNRILSGENIITTPGGYISRFTFPARDIVSKYLNQERNISIISNLSLTVPATPVSNDFGVPPAPYMLMIKTSEIDEFFANNKIPDGKTSFYAKYDTSAKQYRFGALRPYLIDLLEKGTITDDDVDFTFFPVSITGETVEPTYYGGTATFYVTGCTPYTLGPTMTKMDTKNATIVFTFSSQISQ